MTDRENRGNKHTVKPSRFKWIEVGKLYLIRLCGGYSKKDLDEACKISYAMGDNKGDGDAIDVRSWHMNKFGTHY